MTTATRADIIARLTIHHLTTYPQDITFDAALRQAVADALDIERAAQTVPLRGLVNTELVVNMDPLWPPPEALRAQIITSDNAPPILTMSRVRSGHTMLLGSIIIGDPAEV